MSDETFSFRWGIPILDGGHTVIPNFMLEGYAQMGVTRQEFLAIVHLARYQYESADAECRPSVATVAVQMGYSERSLQRIYAGLEKRGLLVRRYRTGETTVYDFSGFSRKVLELSTGGGDTGVTPDKDVTPGGDTGVRGGVTRMSPKEEKPRRKQQEEKVVAGPASVLCSIHDTPMERREKDGAAWWSHRLADGSWCKGAPGDQPGAKGKRGGRDPRDYVSGEYADYIQR